nr:NAD(P)-dependent alcohol dehydrogenase [uncultured Chryseobacterium sp.]
MKKVVYNKYGSVEVLHLEEIEKPVPSNQQLLVKVKSVSLNPLDWKIFTGEVKLMSGAKFPKFVGCDFSGVIESVGANAVIFKEGDEVFGLLDPFKEGVLGEYILIEEKQVSLKPKELSFEYAASIPTAGQTALQILMKSNISEGQNILINGASGGVGMFAIQIAKQEGAIVTAVAGTKAQDLLKKWGSDNTIDYTKNDLSRLNRKFDIIVELSNKLPFSKAKKLMNDDAIYITALPSLPVFINSFLNNLFSRKKYKFIMMKTNSNDLDLLAANVLKGIDIHISRTYSLAEYREAYENFSKEGAVGKVVITI